MLRNCLGVVLLVGLCLPVRAQTEVNVNPLTGIASVNLPLGKAYAGGIEIPVSLVYRGGGVRVNESEGSAGMGWEISAGDGAVSREVRGLPDDYSSSSDSRKGWIYSGSRSGLVNFNPTADNGCSEWVAFNSLNGMEDTEPDIFHFSAPGLSGSFVFDHNNVIRPLPYQDVAITYTTINDAGVTKITSFTIINDRGVKYVFDVRNSMTRRPGLRGALTFFDRDYTLYSNSLPQYNPWFDYKWSLRSITGTGGETVTYTYTREESESQKNFRRVNTALNKVDTVYREQDIVQSTRVSKIETSNNYTVTFGWTYNERLASVKFSADGVSREFTLVYSSVTNPLEQVPANRIVSRNYLTKVFEQNECDALPAYVFEYYSPESLPYKAGYPQDFFGYFNNATIAQNLALIPATYQNNAAINGEQYRIYPKSGYTGIVSSTARDVNPATSYYGSLKKISYPSGGFSELGYESNQYYDDATTSDAYGAGIRVASLRVSDGDTDASNDILKTYEYKNVNGTSSGHWLYPPAFAFSDGTGVFISPDNLAPSETIYYDRSTTIEAGNGKIVYDYVTPARYPAIASGDWTATKSRLVSQVVASCPSQGNLVSGYYSFPFAPNTYYDFEQGLVSSIQYLNSAGKVVREQLFTYQRLARTAVTIKALQFEKANVAGGYAYGLYTIMANLDKPVSTVTIKDYDDVSATLNVASATNNVYQASGRLQETNLTNSDGILSKTQYKYAGDFVVTSPSATDLQAKMIQKLQTLNRPGAVIETTQWSGSSPKASALNLYDDFGTSNVYLKSVYGWAGSGTFQPAALSTGSAQQFTWDPAYVVTQAYESYTPKGQPGVVTDRSRKVISMLYASDNVTPVATIVNALTGQVLFSDFENAQAYQLAAVDTLAEAWSGKGGYTLRATSPVTKSSITKTQSAYYRFRCRAKATTATNITLSLKLTNTSAGWNTITLTYPASKSGQWVLLDQMVPMSTVAATFSAQFVVSANLMIDDVALYPDDGSIVSRTFTLLRGKTSETDNRGNTSFYEYDWLGRPSYLRDTNKDILESHEYRYAVTPLATPKAGFTCTGCDTELIVGNVIVLDAFQNCITGVTYTWKVDGVVVDNDSQLSYVFTQPRKYRIELTAEHPVYGSNTASIEYSIQPAPVVGQISGNFSPIICTPIADNRTFSVSLSGCYDNNSNLKCRWYLHRGGSEWMLMQETTGVSDFTFNMSTWAYTQPITIRCEIEGTCSEGIIQTAVLRTVDVEIPLDGNYLPCQN